MLISCNSKDSVDENISLEPKILNCNIDNDMSLIDHNPNGVDYIVECGIDVYASMIINPGTTIQFEEGTYINFLENSKLTAIGTKTDKIRFVGSKDQQSTWAGLYIANNANRNIIQHAVFMDAGYKQKYGSIRKNRAAILTRNATVSFSNLDIVNSGENGMVFLENTKIENIDFINFIGNKYYPIIVPLNNLREIRCSHCTFQDNGKSYILVQTPLGSNQSLVEETFLQKQPIPFLFLNDLVIDANFILTPGVELVMGLGVRMEVIKQDVFIKIFGKSNGHVVIRGEKPLSRYWSGMYLNAKSLLYEFHFLDISDGGSNTFDWGKETGNIILAGYNKSTLKLKNCTSSNSGNCDIVLNERWQKMKLENDNTNLVVCREK